MQPAARRHRSVSRRSAAKPGWNWEGGTAITVQQGDTIDGLVTRYGVPAAAIAEANNIPNGTALKPGQRLVIPKYEVTGSDGAARRVQRAAHAGAGDRGARHQQPASTFTSSRPARR